MAYCSEGATTQDITVKWQKAGIFLIQNASLRRIVHLRFWRKYAK